MNNLIFEAESHLYRLDGVELPGVTKVLRAAGFIDDVWFTREAKDRGTAVHLATQFLDEGDLSEEWQRSQPALMGYINGYKRFLRESGFTHGAIERAAYHETYRYAGTVDRIGTLKARTTLLDIKTGGPQPWHALQLAAYQGLCEPGPWQRMGLYLHADGTYTTKAYDDRNDWSVFLAALSIYNWRINHGV